MNRVFIFLLGAAAGSLVTWKLIDEKYKRLADEEIAEVVEYYKSKEEAKKRVLECKSSTEKVEPKWAIKSEEQLEEEKKVKEEYKNNVVDLGYTVELEPTQDYITPYTIAPEELGEVYGYPTKTWTYYADGVLTNEVGEIVVDPDIIIADALEHFDDYEDDSVCVRNDNLECDIRIIKEEMTFKELNGEDD